MQAPAPASAAAAPSPDASTDTTTGAGVSTHLPALIASPCLVLTAKIGTSGLRPFPGKLHQQRLHASHIRRLLALTPVQPSDSD